MIYKLYTDGATSNNGYEDSRGGYAWALLANDQLYDYESYMVSPATNNYCELMALIRGCERVEADLEPFDVVLVYSDSAYCINCYKQRWYENWQRNGWMNSKKQPVANRELWEKLIPYFDDVRFKFEKVKGHADDKWNNFVDKLAVQSKFEKK